MSCIIMCILSIIVVGCNGEEVMCDRVCGALEYIQMAYVEEGVQNRTQCEPFSHEDITLEERHALIEYYRALGPEYYCCDTFYRKTHRSDILIAVYTGIFFTLFYSICFKLLLTHMEKKINNLNKNKIK
jgi:hypothetical protein